MAEQIRAVFVVSVVRSLIELLGGVWLLLVSYRWQPWSFGGGELLPGYHPDATPQEGDQLTFAVLGIVLGVLGGLRFAQALGWYFARIWAKRLTLVLAILDFLTPVTLPFGLWHLKVYASPDSKEHFRSGTGGAEGDPARV